MRTPLWLLAIPILAGCSFDDGQGSQIGSLKESSVPQPPADLEDLDIAAAVREALRIGGIATMATAWSAHVASLGYGSDVCPNTWLGAPPERFVDIDGLDEDAEALSWFDNCTTTQGNSFQGFSYWENQVDMAQSEGNRTILMDAQIRDGAGNLLFDFDGESTDQLQGGVYSSSMTARVLEGSLLGLGSGIRGELDASWSGSGMELFGAVHLEDGFGPPDMRSPSLSASPELTNVTDWEQGMPRFTSVRFDLDFDGDCPLEPRGYVGVRGNEGFWFDVYFLPKYDPVEDLSRAASFPFEAIDNLECDGIGTLFVRNLDLRQAERVSPDWSRELQFDFGTIIAGMPTPDIAGFTFSLQDLPQPQGTP